MAHTQPLFNFSVAHNIGVLISKDDLGMVFVLCRAACSPQD